MVSVTRQGGPQPTVVCWSKGSSEKGRHLEPKAPSFHFLEVLAGVKSHGSGWWGAHDSHGAQAGGVPQGRCSPEPPARLRCPLLSCPHHAPCGQGLEGTVPDTLNASAPGAALPGRGEQPRAGDTLPPHMAHRGAALALLPPRGGLGSRTKGLGPGPLTRALCGQTRFQDSQPQDGSEQLQVKARRGPGTSWE